MSSADREGPGWAAEELFAGKPGPYALFLAAQRLVASVGPCDLRVTKTQVAFAARRQFAWVWLPPARSKQRPPGSIVLSFALPRRVEHAQVVESVEPYPGRWMHHVIVAQESDLGADVAAWLAEAYHWARSSQ